MPIKQDNGYITTLDDILVDSVSTAYASYNATMLPVYETISNNAFDVSNTLLAFLGSFDPTDYDALVYNLKRCVDQEILWSFCFVDIPPLDESVWTICMAIYLPYPCGTSYI